MDDYIDLMSLRGPKNAYGWFCESFEKENEKNNVKITFNEQSRKCYEKWKLMTKEEREPYQVMADVELEDHEETFGYWYSEKPQSKMTAYSYFFRSVHKEDKKNNPDSDIDFIELSNKCLNKWKLMTNEEKESFKALIKEVNKKD